MIDKNRMEIFHRTKLSIEEKDTSFFNYLLKYGLISYKRKKESDKNYLKSGIYCTHVLKNDKNYNEHYGKWVLKGFINDLYNFFFIDYNLYVKHIDKTATVDKYLGDQFEKFGYKTKSLYKVNPILIYTKQYYKIYRIIEKDLDKIKDKINGIIFDNFNYLDNTDISIFKNKFIDNYQLIVYKPELIMIENIKWINWNNWKNLKFKCKYFDIEEYIVSIKHFSKQKNISVLKFFNTYKMDFNPAIYDKEIDKELNLIYSKLSIDEINELYKILPNKFLLKEFNPGIEILEKYLKE